MSWNDIETLAKLARCTPYAFIIAGFLVAISGQLVQGWLGRRIETLAKLARYAPYALIVVGFLVALAGQYVQGRLSSRVDALQDQAEAQRRRTPPKLDAQLAISDKANLFVVIDALNEIPFTAHWVVVTKKDVIVSAIMTEDEEFHPTSDQLRWQYKQKLHSSEIEEDFVKLRFSWRSLYWADLNRPSELKGEIVHSYRLANGVRSPLCELGSVAGSRGPDLVSWAGDARGRESPGEHPPMPNSYRCKSDPPPGSGGLAHSDSTRPSPC